MFGQSPASLILSGSVSHDRSSSDDYRALKKKPRRNSGFFGSRNSSSADVSQFQLQRRPGTADSEIPAYAAPVFTATPEGLRPRRKSVQHKKRTSMFGNLRSQHSLEDFEGSLSLRRSKASYGDDDDRSLWRYGAGSMVMHHGEVQTTGGMWRKKSQYLVLTETHLIRFKSQSKAADIFPSITASFTPGSRQSIASMNSLQDPQMVAQSETAAGIPLNSIIAVYVLDDGRPSSTVEVAYLDEHTHKACLIQMHTPDLQELNLWMTGIRSAAGIARSVNPLPIDQRSIEYVVSVLEHEKDYDPMTFRAFRVLQMASSKSAARSSDDLTKLSPIGSYLAIGSHKIHLISLQKAANRASSASLADLDSSTTSFGLMTLTGLSMEWGDDSLHLTFRYFVTLLCHYQSNADPSFLSTSIPLCKPFSVFLASVHSVEVALWIRQHSEFLRPLWTRQPYHFIVPREIDNEDNLLPVDLEEDYGCFDRTLVAYSASYDIDTSNIRYTIDVQCEDAPCFKLLPPASPNRQRYTALELIAVMRSLRYNDSFRSISFSGISLDALRGVRDPYGPDKDAFVTRAGSRIAIPGQENLSVLAQEIRALVLKSKWLRRLDFSYCLAQTRALDNGQPDTGGCDIPEAIFPIIRRELLTSVDWIILNGIKFGESDLDYLVDAASQRGSHLRALEVGNCGLSVHDLDLLLSTIVAQDATLEAINISEVQGRLTPDTLQQYLGYFGQLRKVDLSRISRTSGSDPLITAETLFNWRLEELSLSQTAVNRETTSAIATYLASDKSRGLRVLRLDQCGLTGEDVAMLLHSTANDTGAPRNLHIYVNENRLDTACSSLSDAIARNHTPSHLSMRMIDFQREEHFRELVEALRKNKTLKFLDISKASLPYDAGPETCRSLQLMLEENDTLEDLDISGESAHLDVARFGIGLNLALTGLKKNRSLKVLRIEHQRLGFQGASTLASVLEENNCLREIYCENNEINLQSFTVLVNGLERNTSLLSLSCMDQDRIQSLERMRREIEIVTAREPLGHTQTSHASSLRRSIYAAVGHVGAGNKLTKNSAAHMHHRNGVSSAPVSTTALMSSESAYLSAGQEADAVLVPLNLKWDSEVARLRGYLFRNYSSAHGIDGELQQEVFVNAPVDILPVADAEASPRETVEFPKLEVILSDREEETRPALGDMPPLQLLDCSGVGEEEKQQSFNNSTTTSTDFEIFAALDSGRDDFNLDIQQRPQTAPFAFSEPPPPPLYLQAFPTPSLSTPGSSASSVRRAPVQPFPVMQQPLATDTNKPKKGSRSARSSSASTGTGTDASIRSRYSSALRGLVGRGASKEKKRLEKSRKAITPVYNASEKPPIERSLSEKPPSVKLPDDIEKSLSDWSLSEKPLSKGPPADTEKSLTELSLREKALSEKPPIPKSLSELSLREKALSDELPVDIEKSLTELSLREKPPPVEKSLSKKPPSVQLPADIQESLMSDWSLSDEKPLSEELPGDIEKSLSELFLREKALSEEELPADVEKPPIEKPPIEKSLSDWSLHEELPLEKPPIEKSLNERPRSSRLPAIIEKPPQLDWSPPKLDLEFG